MKLTDLGQGIIAGKLCSRDKNDKWATGYIRCLAYLADV